MTDFSFLDELFLSKKKKKKRGELNTTESWKCNKRKKIEEEIKLQTRKKDHKVTDRVYGITVTMFI